MSGDLHNFFINSPVFTREDEERYHYVNTEVEGLTEDGDIEQESLINGRHFPPVLAGDDQCEPADQAQKHVHESVVRDSLEADHGHLSDSSNNVGGIVVVDPSRYEDLTVGATDRRAVLSDQEKGNGRFNQQGNSEASRLVGGYYLRDDVAEYEEARLERQHQRQQARRAHVPHLQLSHSDDEAATCSGEGAFDLEIDDGHTSNQQYSSQKNSRGRVTFGALPDNSASASSNQLADSLELAEYHPDTEGVGGNPGYEGSIHADHWAHGKNEPHGSHNSAHPLFSVHKSRHRPRGDAGQYHNVPPVEDEKYQGHAAVQNSSAKQQQLPIRSQPSSWKTQVPQHSQPQGQTLQTSNARRQPPTDEGFLATDFVEANRHNVNRKAHKTYGQIYSRKKGKENTVDSDQTTAHRAVDTTSLGREKLDAAQAFDEQRSHPPNIQGGESREPSAEQLWHARSQRLAARNESAAKSQRCKAVPSQNKVIRDVRVNESRPVVSSIPHQHHPDVHQFPVSGSFTVPIPVQPEVPGDSPQKVSVDINLNVLSPRPLLNQPSTSLPIQYMTPQEIYQHSSRTQAFSNQYQHPSTSQLPLSNVPQPVVPQSTLPYTASTVFSQPHSAPQFVCSGRQQPTPRYFDAYGLATPMNQASPQHLPVRYNYTYPQPLAMPVSDASPRLVHPYQLQQVIFVNF